MNFAVTDLNFDPAICKPAMNFHAGTNHVFRQAGARATHGSSSAAYLSPNRQTIRQRIQSNNVFLSRSRPLTGLRTTDLSREPTRYRNLFTGSAIQALSSWHPFECCSQYTHEYQRRTRLSHLRRLRAEPDGYCAPNLLRKFIRRRPEKHRLCTGHDNHRYMLVSLSIGTISIQKSRRQNAYIARLTREYPELYPYQRRQAVRSQCSRQSPARSGSFLHHGSWLHRLCSPIAFTKRAAFSSFAPNQTTKHNAVIPILWTAAPGSFAIKPSFSLASMRKKTSKHLCEGFDSKTQKQRRR